LRREGIGVPQNGEYNTQFGLYGSVCCGSEIVIRAGAKFPKCPKHPEENTRWEPIEIPADDFIALKKNSQSKPAA